jgi:hypothetical protein
MERAAKVLTAAGDRTAEVGPVGTGRYAPGIGRRRVRGEPTDDAEYTIDGRVRRDLEWICASTSSTSLR